MKDLVFRKDAASLHIVNIHDDFERIVARHFQNVHCPLTFVELDGVLLDVHGGAVSPEEFESVGAGHLILVLYLYPRLGEVGKNRQWVLIAETHILLVELDKLLSLDVCDDHGEADLCRGFLDVVDRPDRLVVLCEAEEIFLSRLSEISAWTFSGLGSRSFDVSALLVAIVRSSSSRARGRHPNFPDAHFLH